MHKNKILGSLIGGACGDALGYAVEFDSEETIQKTFGENGITEYVLSPNGEALISDDTQMTLFTANGLMSGIVKKFLKDNQLILLDEISKSYLDWYTTQINPHPIGRVQSSWIANLPQLYNLRAPGNTCIAGCYYGANGTIKNPINNSNGCGGVMRVAPIGLLYKETDENLIEKVDMFGMEVAALTHGHPLGYIPAGALVHIINRITYANMTPLQATADSILMLNRMFSGKFIDRFTEKMHYAIDLTEKNLSDVDCINKLGEGWTGYEALAIAVFCAIKYSEDFERGIIAAVNHSGDSDSTGSITGNILGAYLGFDSIPKKFTEKLELLHLITEISTDLYFCSNNLSQNAVYDDIWMQKYLYDTYCEI